MYHLMLVVIIITTLSVCLALENTSMRIKKCCPEHQQLYLDDSDNLKCANVEHIIKNDNNRTRAKRNKHLGGDECENDRPRDSKTNGNNETFGEMCDKQSNEIKNENTDTNNKNSIWWIPSDLKFIRTNNDTDISTIENLNLNRDSFIFDKPIPCFNQEPEFQLIDETVFIDVVNSELVLTKLENAPAYYKVKETNYEKQPNQATNINNRHGDILNDTQTRNENLFDNEENWKINTNRSEVRKQGFGGDVKIVTRDYDSRPMKITSRFHSDDFCIDRIVFKFKSDADDGILLKDDIDDTKGLPHANDASNTSPDHLDEKDTNPNVSTNGNDANTEDTGTSNDSSYVILLCPCLGKSSRNVVCVKKCCPERQHLYVSNDQDKDAHCAPFSNTQADLGDSQVFSSDLDEEPGSLRNTLHYIVHAIPRCSHGSYLLRNHQTSSPTDTTHTLSPTHTTHPYKIMANSTVLLTSSRYLVSPNEYCIDSIYYAKSGRTSDSNILLCRPARVGETSTLRRLVYTTCFIVGTTFLVLTLGVYVMLSELRKSVHSWNIISHVACSIVAYVGIVVANLYNVQYPGLCVLLAYVIQVSFLSSQLWLNVMCIDIAFTFSGLRAPRGSNFSSMDRQKFFYYSCYTWGITACIAGLTALADQTSILSASDPLKPNFGVKSCWFKESTALAVFFYGPIGVLLVVNLMLFHYTCWKIRSAQKETAITSAHRHVGGRNEEQTRLATFLKLFLLMGVTWSFELLSWSLGGPRYIWYLTDLLNVLRGVFIFIILCCKRHVFCLLKKRIQHGHRTLTRPGGYRPRTESNTSRRYSKSSITTEQMALSRLNLQSNPQPRILEEEEGRGEPPPIILGSVQEEGKGY